MKRKLFLSVMLIALLYIPVRAANTTLVLTAPEGEIAAGESFTVSVDIQDNPGLLVMQFVVNYNTEDMDCEAAKGSELLQNMMYVTNPNGEAGAVVVGVAIEPVVGDGELLVLKFTAKRALMDPDFRLTNIMLQNADGEEIQSASEEVRTEPAPPKEEDFAGISDDGTDIGTGGFDVDPAVLEPVPASAQAEGAAPDVTGSNPVSAEPEETAVPGDSENISVAGDVSEETPSAPGEIAVQALSSEAETGIISERDPGGTIDTPNKKIAIGKIAGSLLLCAFGAGFIALLVRHRHGKK